MVAAAVEGQGGEDGNKFDSIGTYIRLDMSHLYSVSDQHNTVDKLLRWNLEKNR